MADRVEKTGDRLAGLGQALGDEFFRGEAGKHREALREADSEATRELASASGITDATLLDRLTALGIRAETLAALTLVPLVEVAWADGMMGERERDAILRGASSTGLGEDTWSYRLLRIWTHDRPAPELLEAWTRFISELASELDDTERSEFKRKVVGLARDVAKAAGGFLGVGAISSSEQALLARVDDAFLSDGPGKEPAR